MQQIDIDVQKKMQKELQKYLTHESESKDYFISMKEISTWLQEKAK